MVYAGWLQERGDPRGEFIRLRWERARHLADPSSSQSPQPCFDREAELLARFPEVALDRRVDRSYSSLACKDGRQLVRV